MRYLSCKVPSVSLSRGTPHPEVTLTMTLGNSRLGALNIGFDFRRLLVAAQHRRATQKSYSSTYSSHARLSHCRQSRRRRCSPPHRRQTTGKTYNTPLPTLNVPAVNSRLPSQIEFPSILLPPDIHSGSIVDINVARNQHAEALAEQKFTSLQNEIYSAFGSSTPSAPNLRCRNTTQTSIVLEWDPIDLATAELRSLSLYRNGTKAGVIPRDKLSTKISGLAVDTEYTFHLVLRTSAGQYSSERLSVRTHKMTDLTGITITPGVMPAQLKDSLAETVQKIGAKLIDSVRIDTTHFVCTEPRGQAWEKAVEMNVPVVVPDWVKGCEREGRLVGVRGYYLDADPKHRQIGPSQAQQQQQQQQQQAQQQAQHQRMSSKDSPRIEHTPPTPERASQDPNGAHSSSSSPPASRHVPRPADERLAESNANTDEQSITGTTIVAKETDDDDDEEEDGDGEESDDTERGSQDSGEKMKEKSRIPFEREEGRDVVAEHEAAGEDGKFDEVAL